MAGGGDRTSYESELAHYWWPRADLWVVSLFDSPPLDAARRLTDRMAEIRFVHRTLFDARGLTAVSPEPFAHLTEFVTEHREVIERHVERVAVLLLSSLGSAISHGVVAMTGIDFPVEVFEDAAAAFAWLGVEDARAMAAELDRRIERARSILPRLRRFLRDSPSASLDEAARALAVSTRQLQRLLKKLEVSYRDERTRVRVDLARGLLRTTDLKVEAVAAEVGYAKLQNFVDAFRKITGQTPAAWRSEREGTGVANLD